MNILGSRIMIYQVLYLITPNSHQALWGRNFYLHLADQETDNIKQLVQNQMIITEWQGWNLNLGLPDCKYEYFHQTALPLSEIPDKNEEEGKVTCSEKDMLLLLFTIRCLEKLSRQVFLICNIFLKWLLSNYITNWIQIQNFIKTEKEKPAIIPLNSYFFEHLQFFTPPTTPYIKTTFEILQVCQHTYESKKRCILFD